MSRRSLITPDNERSPIIGWILGLLGIVILGGIAVLGIYATLNARSTDRATGCPTDHYDNVTVVLVDLTDRIGPVQAVALRNAIVGIRDSIPAYGRLEIYPLVSTTASAIEPVFAACSPGNGKDFSNRLYQNPELADRIWRKQFGDKVDTIISKIETQEPQDNSPILEAIQSVAVTGFDTPLAQDAHKKRLVIVSDMLHYTPELSMYRGAPAFDDFKRTQYYLRTKTDLRGANADVYLIVRETRRNAQQPPLFKFWVDYFDANGGYLRNWDLLQ